MALMMQAAAVPLAHAATWTAQIPVVLVVLAGAGYLVAVRPARTATRSRRSLLRARRRTVAFFAGLVVVLVALTGPVERFAEDLFWVHMVQHLLLLTVAAPLLVIAAPWVLPLRLLSPNARRGAVSWWRGSRSARPIRAVSTVFGLPAVAWILFNANLLVWHVPAAFDLTLRSEPVHDLEHLLFLGLGVLFWAQVIDSPPLRPRLGHLQRAIYVGAAAAVGWALSIALTLAPSALYEPYGELVARPGGLSGLADQRVAAGVMLVPGSIAFIIVAGLSLTRWLDDDGSGVATGAWSGRTDAQRAASWDR
jgi:putative membrane protein